MAPPMQGLGVPGPSPGCDKSTTRIISHYYRSVIELSLLLDAKEVEVVTDINHRAPKSTLSQTGYSRVDRSLTSRSGPSETRGVVAEHSSRQSINVLLGNTTRHRGISEYPWVAKTPL